MKRRDPEAERARWRGGRFGWPKRGRRMLDAVLAAAIGASMLAIVGVIVFRPPASDLGQPAFAWVFR